MREKRKNRVWSKKDAIIMWSIWVKGITLLVLISAVLAYRGQEGCTCGALGSGSNPCSCNNVVVEATEVTKPIVYASPEAINEATIIREGGKPACTETQTNSFGGISETNINDNTIGSSDSFSSSIVSDLPRKYVSSELTDIITQTEPTSPNLNVQIVPSFSPVNNLCNPSRSAQNVISGTRVKVTPAYPGQMKCCKSNPYQACIKYISGIRGDPSSVTTHIGTPIGSPQFGSGSYSTSSITYDADSPFLIPNELSQLKTGNGDYSISNINHDTYTPFGSPLGTHIGSGSYSTSSITYDASSPFLTPNELSQLKTGNGDYSISSINHDTFTPFGSPLGTYMGLPQSEFGNRGYGTSNTIHEIPLQHRLQQDRLPADPISLTLAYKNLVAPKIYYNKGKKLFSEGSLSFGHRTLPIELKKEKKLIDVPEEKLVTVDRPIMELKLSPASSIMIEDNDDEADNLAELEAMERENLLQSEQLDRVASNFLSYGEVGYRPIDVNVVSPNIALVTQNAPSLNTQGVDQRILSNGERNGIGGIKIGQNVDYISKGGRGLNAPLLSGYVPGSVIVQHEIETEEPQENEQIDINSYNYNVDNFKTNKEIGYNSGLGIIDRLRNAAQKNRSFCSR